MRHEIEHNGNWLVPCRPWYHSIEGAGIEVFTPQVRQNRTACRCVADPEAQYFLGWQQGWVDDVLGPDPRRTRLDPRPMPWLGDFMIFGIRRMRSREIIGHAWIELHDGVAEGSVGFRPDQRRSGLAMGVGFAGMALLQRHLGYREAIFHTSSANEGVRKAANKAGYESEERLTDELPDGRSTDTDVYRSIDEDAVCACRWPPERWRPPWP